MSGAPSASVPGDGARPCFAVCSVGTARWFWAVWPSSRALHYGERAQVTGYAASKRKAWQAANDAGGVTPLHNQMAAHYHRRLACERRAARPSTDTATTALEFVYRKVRCEEYGIPTWIPHRIVKRTARYVYIDRETYRATDRQTGTWYDHDIQTIRLDRDELERAGAVSPRSRWATYYLEPSVTGREAPQSLTLLGLATPCDERDVRRAYRHKARQAHPDQGGSAEAFKQIQRAYEDALRFVGGAA